MTGCTLACVLIQLEGWLDKTRVEIVVLDCSGCGTPATTRNSVTIRFEIWQCERRVRNEKITCHRFGWMVFQRVQCFDPNIKRTNRKTQTPSYL